MTTPEPRMRKCAGCGYRFRAYGPEVYCSGPCAALAAQLAIVAGLRRFAEANPAPLTQASGGGSHG